MEASCLSVSNVRDRESLPPPPTLGASSFITPTVEAEDAVRMIGDRPLGFKLRIQVGNSGTLATVETLQAACDVLIAWPHARRGPFYQSARELVERALKGEKPVREAAEGFLALCEHAGVVVHD